MDNTRHDGALMQPEAPIDPAAAHSERFAICGDVGAAVFARWIARHATRLGLRGAILHHEAQRLEMVVTGLPDLLDAMALACSLGPREVWVDDIERAAMPLQNVSEFASTAD
ncbi:acylphosphatase [Cypionkella sinensis]|uniref:Acylphosphatase n=1 Tax=Cypionkella sinensis TaxID=1756043 RepID=A0ABV7IY55_9RHOB